MGNAKQTLVIVESPAKAKTIEKYLGEGYEVVASVGHVRDLPKSNKKAIDIEGGFVPHYEISKGKERVIEEITRRAKKSKEVLLATDPDREGEAIAWHVAIAAGLDPDKTKRVVFHEITKNAVQEAIEHPRPIDENLRRAQEARRVLDRLVGYDLSGLIWKKVRYGLSAGRVQSPALRIIMEREREIRAFKPETFWTIEADTLTKNKTSLLLTCVEEPRAEKEMKRIVSAGEKNPWRVVDIKATEAKRTPYPPFTTSTLQQTASSRLGFSPSRTMSVAQRLYEAGLITYMRTDSTNLSGFAIGAAADTIKKMYGEEYLTIRKFTTKSKNAQEAHEAIRPTDISKTKAGHDPEQQRLYTLIWQRTVASQMTDAKILRTRILAIFPAIQFPTLPQTARKLFSPDGSGPTRTREAKTSNFPLSKRATRSRLSKSTRPKNKRSRRGDTPKRVSSRNLRNAASADLRPTLQSSRRFRTANTSSKKADPSNRPTRATSSRPFLKIISALT